MQTAEAKGDGAPVALVDGMPQREWELAETELEERDGDVWVSGLCPGCWERFAFRAPPRGRVVRVRCPNGHPLVIREQTSAGAHTHP